MFRLCSVYLFIYIIGLQVYGYAALLEVDTLQGATGQLQVVDCADVLDDGHDTADGGPDEAERPPGAVAFLTDTHEAEQATAASPKQLLCLLLRCPL